MIPAIVLAAGKSSRMGRPKALLPIGPSGETFLTRILHVLRGGGIPRTFVVIGGDAGAVRASLPPGDGTFSVVENRHYEHGQLSSLLAGLSAAEENDNVDAAMVTLVDLPLISETTVRAVLEAQRHSPERGHRAAAPRGTPRPPRDLSLPAVRRAEDR